MLPAALALPAAASAGQFADNFANATNEFGGKNWYEGLPASTKSATKELGEPEHAGYPGSASVWVPWTSSKNQTVEIWTCGGMDTLLGVYTGTAVNALTEVASNDESSLAHGCGAPNAGVRFEATAGTKYRIAVDAKSEAKKGKCRKKGHRAKPVRAKRCGRKHSNR